MVRWVRTYLFVGIIIHLPIRFPIILVLVLFVLFIFIVVIFKVIGIHVVTQLFELKCLACKPINGAGNKLFFDVFAKLVVELKTLLNVGGNSIVVICGGLRRREEVEEGLGGDSNLDNASLLGV